MSVRLSGMIIHIVRMWRYSHVFRFSSFFFLSLYYRHANLNAKIDFVHNACIRRINGSRDTCAAFFRVNWFYTRWFIVCHNQDIILCNFYKLWFRSLTKDVEVHRTPMFSFVADKIANRFYAITIVTSY